MHKYLRFLFFGVFLPLSLSSVAGADVVKLKSGQVHEGTVTAEEEGRLQLKLDGSGVRIWFAKDQIASVDRASQKEPEQKQTASEPAANTEGLSEDVIRAKELLKKMREQPDNSGNRTNPTPSASNASSSEITAPPANTSEVEKLIEQFRNGKFYERLNACKKLGILGAKEAIPYLIYYLDDDNLTIRQESNKSLIKITGEDFHFNPTDKRSVRQTIIEEWKKWHEAQKKKEGELNLKSLW